MLGRGEQGGRAGVSPRSLSSSSAGNTRRPAPKPISAGAAWGSRFMSMIDICLSCVFCVCVCLLAFLRVLVQGMAKRDAKPQDKAPSCHRAGVRGCAGRGYCCGS